MNAARGRLESLDALRGIAALAVVFWHWQHFWFVGSRADVAFRKDQQPVYSVFFLLYERGYLAVDLFFTLSGFVFFWLYADSIGRRSVSARRFFVLRFSRLYPLHFVTLLAVAAMQAIYLATTNSYFIYQYNDLYHFVLHVLGIPAIGWEYGWSFNGPIWSVSVEAVVYAFFFALCWALRGKPFLLLAAALAASYVGFSWTQYEPWSRGIGSFFVGGVVCVAYQFIVRQTRARLMATVLSAIAVALWIAVLVDARIDLFAGARRVAPNAMAHFPTLVLFPCTVLALALYETAIRSPAPRLAFLGDASYGIYLWHFPLQLAFALGLQQMGVSSAVFYSPATLIGFIACLLGLAAVSHRYFEMPAQRRIRAAWWADPAPGTEVFSRSRLLYACLLATLCLALMTIVDILLALGIGVFLTSPVVMITLVVIAYQIAPDLAVYLPLRRRPTPRV